MGNKGILQSEMFYVDHLHPNEAGDIADIEDFWIEAAEGQGLSDYLKEYASQEEIDRGMRTYLVRDNETDECVGYFSLKAGLISLNEAEVDESSALDEELSKEDENLNAFADGALDSADETFEDTTSLDSLVKDEDDDDVENALDNFFEEHPFGGKSNETNGIKEDDFDIGFENDDFMDDNVEPASFDIDDEEKPAEFNLDEPIRKEEIPFESEPVSKSSLAAAESPVEYEKEMESESLSEAVPSNETESETDDFTELSSEPSFLEDNFKEIKENSDACETETVYPKEDDNMSVWRKPTAEEIEDSYDMLDASMQSEVLKTEPESIIAESEPFEESSGLSEDVSESEESECENLEEPVQESIESFATEVVYPEEDENMSVWRKPTPEEIQDSYDMLDASMLPGGTGTEDVSQKSEDEEYVSPAAELFVKLKDLSFYLPSKTQQEFFGSKKRLQLDYIVSRLKGNSGLLRNDKDQISVKIAEQTKVLLKSQELSF